MIGKRFRPLPFIFSLFANDNYTLSRLKREVYMGNGNFQIPKNMLIESGFQGIWENEPLW